MQRLETQEDKEKKAKRKQYAIGIVLLAIMILSTAGYGFYSATQGDNGSQPGVIDYNGFKFYDSNGYWQTQINGENLFFRYLPNETDRVYARISNTLDSYKGMPLYFVSDNPEAESEIARVLQSYAARLQQACIVNCSDKNLPIKNCSSDNIIVIQEADKSEINQNLKCVFIKSPLNESIMASEEFLYRILGVKKDLNMPKFI